MDTDDRLLWRRHRRRPTDRTRAALAARYLPLVFLTVQRLAGRAPAEGGGPDPDDLRGAGRLGLARALEHFDPTRGVRFETYAIALIRGAVLEERRAHGWAPRSVQEEAARLAAARAAVQQETLGAARPAETAALLGISGDALAEMEARVDRQALAPLDADANDWQLYPEQPGVSITLADYVLEPRRTGAGRADGADVARDVEAGARREALARALGRLPTREARVLRLWTGAGGEGSGNCLGDGEGATLRLIGAGMGVSESRAYQLAQQGLRRLRGMADVRDWAPD